MTLPLELKKAEKKWIIIGVVVMFIFAFAFLLGFVNGIQRGNEMAYDGLGVAFQDSELTININETAMMCLISETLNQSGYGILSDTGCN